MVRKLFMSGLVFISLGGVLFERISYGYEDPAAEAAEMDEENRETSGESAEEDREAIDEEVREGINEEEIREWGNTWES